MHFYICNTVNQEIPSFLIVFIRNVHVFTFRHFPAIHRAHYFNFHAFNFCHLSNRHNIFNGRKLFFFSVKPLIGSDLYTNQTNDHHNIANSFDCSSAAFLSAGMQTTSAVSFLTTWFRWVCPTLLGAWSMLSAWSMQISWLLVAALLGVVGCRADNSVAGSRLLTESSGLLCLATLLSGNVTRKVSSSELAWWSCRVFFLSMYYGPAGRILLSLHDGPDPNGRELFSFVSVHFQPL